MTVTISYTAFLLTILAVVGVAALVYFTIVLARINRSIARLDPVIDQADQLIGSVKTLVDESTVTVVAARRLIEDGNHLVADVSVVGLRMREFAESDASRALSLIDRLKYFVAMFATAKTAFTSLKHYMERRRQSAADASDH